jgi:hypothetical protein
MCIVAFQSIFQGDHAGVEIASWILQTTEECEFCRRRDRWINQCLMEIYIQEVSSFQYLSAIPISSQLKIFFLCD